MKSVYLKEPEDSCKWETHPIPQYQLSRTGGQEMFAELFFI